MVVPLVPAAGRGLRGSAPAAVAVQPAFVADDDDPQAPREAPGATAFYWLALLAMLVIPMVLIGFAAR